MILTHRCGLYKLEKQLILACSSSQLQGCDLEDDEDRLTIEWMFWNYFLVSNHFQIVN